MVSPVSQTHQIDLGIPSAVAVSAVMLGSIVNAGARLVLPTLADKAVSYTHLTLPTKLEV